MVGHAVGGDAQTAKVGGPAEREIVGDLLVAGPGRVRLQIAEGEHPLEQPLVGAVAKRRIGRGAQQRPDRFGALLGCVAVVFGPLVILLAAVITALRWPSTVSRCAASGCSGLG